MRTLKSIDCGGSHRGSVRNKVEIEQEWSMCVCVGGQRGERENRGFEMRVTHLCIYPQLTASLVPGPYPYLPYALGGGTPYITPSLALVVT